MSTISLSVNLDTITCWKCGITYGMPTDYVEKRRQDHETFWCPNGHGAVFSAKSKAEILAEQLAREKHLREQETARLRDRLSAEEFSHRATRGVVTKMRKRAANGVCPCCTRSFANLRRHMATKHPDFAEPASAGAPS